MYVPDVPINQIWLDSLDAWIFDMQCRGFSATTVRSRRSAGRVLARTMIDLGRSDPAEVTRADLTGYMLARQKGSSGPEGASTHFSNIRSYWSWWTQDTEGAVNPLGKVSAPRPGVLQPPAVLSKDALNALLTACAGSSLESLRNTAIIYMLVSSGLRRAELAALTVDDITFSGSRAILEVRCGKGGKPRTAVSSSAKAVRALGRYMRRRAKEGNPRDSYVFISLRTRRGLTPSGVSQVVDGIGQRAQVDVHPHLFRHTWADSVLSSEAMKESDILTLAGWSTSSMIQRYGASRKTERAVAAALAVPDLV